RASRAAATCSCPTGGTPPCSGSTRGTSRRGPSRRSRTGRRPRTTSPPRRGASPSATRSTPAWPTRPPARAPSRSRRRGCSSRGCGPSSTSPCGCPARWGTSSSSTRPAPTPPASRTRPSPGRSPTRSRGGGRPAPRRRRRAWTRRARRGCSRVGHVPLTPLATPSYLRWNEDNRERPWPSARTSSITRTSQVQRRSERMRLRPHRILLSLVAAIALQLASAQVLIVAQGTDAVTLDPHAATDSPSATVTSHIFETLFELTPEGEVVPGLAESYELSDDGLTLTLKVREGVTFHDGTPLTAHEVKASLDRFLDPENAFTFLFLLEPIQEVVVVDDMTVELRLDAPFAPLIGHLTHSSTAIVHAGVAAELGDGFARNPVGTGPFRFVSWEPNQAIELARYDGYWGEKPGVEGVRFLAVPENTTRMAMVESGAAHVAVRVPPQDIARLDSLSFIDVHNVSSVRTIYIYFNHNIE